MRLPDRAIIVQSQNMRSYFLSKIPPKSVARRRFRAGLRALVSIPDEAVLRLTDSMPTITELQIQGRLRPFVAALLRDLSLSVNTGRSLIDHFCIPLLDSFSSPRGRGDEPQVLAESLIKKKLIHAQHTTRLVAVLKRLKELAPSIREVSRRGETAISPMATFENAWSSVELRAILDREWLGVEDPTTYEPQVTSLIPIASIMVETDDEDFAFQCTEDGLAMLMSAVMAAQRKMHALNRAGRPPQ